MEGQQIRYEVNNIYRIRDLREGRENIYIWIIPASPR